MKRRIFIIFFVAVFVFSLSNCATSPERERSEYGLLCSAVLASSSAVFGEHGESIPPDFKVDEFMEIVKKNIPRDYYEVLRKYRLEIDSKGTYYLLLVFDPDSKALILFDYSCTPECDGQVLLEPS
ncbi:MAG: hypothetical protein ACE144_07895 [Thermodesulfobacteriota bacterium]